MHYRQEKRNTTQQFITTSEISLEIEDLSITYRGKFYTEYKNFTAVKNSVTFSHVLILDKTTGNFTISYEILTKKQDGKISRKSWVRKNKFDKLFDLCEVGFYRGEKRKGFWGAKYDRNVLEFFTAIKKDLQKDMKSPYLKNKRYFARGKHHLFTLIVDYHLDKHDIKGHDSVYTHIQTVYPKHKYLKQNKNKFLPAILEENNIKSKYLVKKLSSPLVDGSIVNIKAVIYICNLFGDDYINYIKRFDWELISNIKFNKVKTHECKNEHERNTVANVLRKHILLKDVKIKNILTSLYTLIDTRYYLEDRGFENLTLKLDQPDDVELLLPLWISIKKQFKDGYMERYNLPDEVIEYIQEPIIVNDKVLIPRILLTNYDFCMEGLSMKNCLAKQFPQAAIHIYISLSRDRKKVDLQYNKGILRMGYGKANSPIPEILFSKAITILSERMIKYKSLTWEKEKIYTTPE